MDKIRSRLLRPVERHLHQPSLWCRLPELLRRGSFVPIVPVRPRPPAQVQVDRGRQPPPALQLLLPRHRAARVALQRAEIDQQGLMEPAFLQARHRKTWGASRRSLLRRFQTSQQLTLPPAVPRQQRPLPPQQLSLLLRHLLAWQVQSARPSTSDLPLMSRIPSYHALQDLLGEVLSR